MKRHRTLLTLVLILALLCSCRSTKVIETIPVYFAPDITEPIGLVVSTKPDRVPSFPADVDTKLGIAKVALAYKVSLEEWQDYADRLESLLYEIQEELNEVKDE